MIKNLLLSNMDIDKTKYEYKQLIMINIALYLEAMVYFVFTVINYNLGKNYIAIMDLMFFLPAIFGIFRLRSNHNINEASSYAIILLFIVTIVVLITFSCKEYTIVWTIFFAFIAFMVKGHRVGLWYVILFYSIVFPLIYGFVGESILFMEYVRFVTATLVIIGIAYSYEKSVFDTFEELKRIHQLVLIEKNKKAQLGDMIGIIAHQWRQPLSVISSIILENIAKNAHGYHISKEEYISSLNKIQEQVDFASHTVEDFRNFFNPNKQKQLVNLREAISVVMNLLKKSFSNNLVVVTQELDLPTKLNIHFNELVQVLLNILKNANEEFKESNQNRTIKIIGYEKENCSYIDIIDNAGGIPKDVLPFIFNKFFTTKEESKGTGLGLDLCKTIIEDQFNGKLTASNTDMNGACFSIRLPS